MIASPATVHAPSIEWPRALSAHVVASIDWLEFSIKSMGPLVVLDALEKILGPAFGRATMTIEVETEVAFFARGPNGVRVSADFRGSVNRHGVREPWVSVCLPGLACRTAGTERLLLLLQALAPVPKVKVSRMDIALDDFTKAFTPRKFATTCAGKDLSDENGKLQPCVITRVKADNWSWDRRVGGCFWLGSAKSPRRLRVYDKERESDGQIKAVRCELQFRDRYATMLAEAIIKGQEAGRPLAEVFLPYLVAFVDLRKPVRVRSNSELWPRLGWWAEFVGQVEAAVTGGEDLTHVLVWERNCAKQGRGFAGVELRAEGMTAEAYRALRRKGCPEAVVVRAMDAILSGELPPPSKEQRERLRELLAIREGLAKAKNPH